MESKSRNLPNSDQGILFTAFSINFNNSAQAKKDLINLAEQVYPKYTQISDFDKAYDEGYKRDTILEWYSKEGPVFKLATELLTRCRFLLQHLEKAIREHYQQESKNFSGVVYRAAFISKKEWKKLQRQEAWFSLNNQKDARSFGS